MGLIPPEIISQVLDRSDIVEVISSYIPLKNAGRDFKALCPFHHEKTPSFVVSPGKQIFHCFGCGLGGNAISYVMHQEHVEFPEAVRMLAEKLGITIPAFTTVKPQTLQLKNQIKSINELALKFYHKNLLSDRGPAAKAARTYLKERNINLDIVKKFYVGFAPDKWDGLIEYLRKHKVSAEQMEKAGLAIEKNEGNGHYDRFRNRIIFPIFDTKARCIAFGARTMEADNPAKYVNSPETAIYTKGRHLYGFHMSKETIGRENSVLVVEGYMDFIMPFQSGVHNIVASLGTALTSGQIRLIRRYTNNVTLLFDSDKAGESAMLRSIDLLIEEGMNVKVVTLKNNEDPDSFIRKYGAAKFKEHVARAGTFFDYKLKLLIEEFGNETAEAKARISAELLPTIDKIKNTIIKADYIKKLSQVLGLPEETLLTELKVLSQGTSYNRLVEEIRQEQIFKNQIRPVEREILRLMLEETSFISLTKEAVNLSDFKNECVRDIIKEMFRLEESGEELTFSKLLSSFNDQEVLQTISGLMTTDEVLIGDKNRVYRDCIKRLKDDRMRSQRKDILHQMELARNSNNQERLEELTRQFNNLVKTKG